VRSALKVEHRIEQSDGARSKVVITLTNVGAAHYLPTGTPDRHLSLELSLLDQRGETIRRESFLMKRYILWRPFIVDLKDTRLAHGKPREYSIEFGRGGKNPPRRLEVTVMYHLLDEKRRRRIGYENKEPIAYTIYRDAIPLN
jgi:hypothetical protein